MNYALIQNDTVQNVIIADAAFADSIRADWQHIAEAGDAGIGWTWDGNNLLPPEPGPSTPIAITRRISVGAFFDRFGTAKWAILADARPTVQAIVKDASVRSYVDLDNADLPAGLALLIAAGHAIDAAAIVDAPVQPQELP